MAELEFKTVTFEVDEKLQAKVQQLEAEGWRPTGKPIMMYHLGREKQEEQGPGGALGVLRIDDSQVLVLGPDGKPK